MVAVLTVSQDTLTDPPSSQALTRMAAELELVLVCDHHVAPVLIAEVRAPLPRHRVVGLLVDAGLLSHERDLLEVVLNEGNLPLVLVTGELGAVQVSEWLNADTASASTAETATFCPRCGRPSVMAGRRAISGPPIDAKMRKALCTSTRPRSLHSCGPEG